MVQDFSLLIQLKFVPWLTLLAKPRLDAAAVWVL